MDDMDDKERIESVAHALVNLEGFEGVVFFMNEAAQESSTFRMVKSPDISDRRVAQILGGVLEVTADPKKMAIDSLVDTLRDHPFFRGVITQELGNEAQPVVGHSYLKMTISLALDNTEAAKMLRAAADAIEESDH